MCLLDRIRVFQQSGTQARFMRSSEDTRLFLTHTDVGTIIRGIAHLPRCPLWPITESDRLQYG